ncbi:hypothetical protein AVEN_234314-1 [Araneus ventricosus]|uniref:HTH psq-type domain-containing protein n=1 Tax=Araneus ventricosus TaxID=182803 RepID=A0A4Y2A9C8_ARAVE|nr:hypothetical protein AVEN_234314-1 [Araneus ventricosus]
MAMHKKNVLDIDTKMEIIKAKEKDNLRGKQIIEKFKIGKSQFYEIFKKNEITQLWLNGNGSTKRKMRKTAKEEINAIVWVILIILTPNFEATRGLFWDRPRNFEPQSDDEDDTCAGTPLSKLPRHTNGRTFGHYV